MVPGARATPHLPVVMKRKRKAENQGAQGVDKKTNTFPRPGRPEIEAYFSHACSLQTTTVLPGTGMTAGDINHFNRIDSFTAFSGIHGISKRQGDAFQSGEEHTDDDSSEWSSSDVACYAPGHCAVSPLLSWSDAPGAMGFAAAAAGTAFSMTDYGQQLAALVTGCHHSGPNNPPQFRNVHHNGRAGGSGAVAAATLVQRNDASRSEMDEWGWFVDAAEPRHE